ncbi:MAG TPA: glycosyltransferase family 39 protein [Planctomycetota bacterium]|nr:glycosyltransferase family 39 protein [Planctomycetota bacterium]
MLDPPRTPRLVLAVLGLLTMVALGARLAGLRTRLPHQPDPDRYIVAEAAWRDRPADATTSSFEGYPQTIYPRLLSFLLYHLPGHSFTRTLPPEAPLAEHLAAASEPFVRGRLLIELLSLVAIPGTYFLAHRFLGAWTSLLAAAFMATSLAGLFYCEQARPHAASMGLSLLAMLAVLRIPRAVDLTAYSVAGVLCAIAVACLWNGVFVCPALLAAHLLAPRRRWIGFAIAVVAVAAAIPLFYGFLFERSLVSSDRVNLGLRHIGWETFNGAGFRQILGGFWSFDPVLVATAGVGILALTVRFALGIRPAAEVQRELLVAATYPVGFVLFWGVMDAVPPRLSQSLLPYVAVLAAFGIQSLLPRRAPALASVALALAALALPAFACAHLVATRSRPDTFTLAARWIASNVDRGRDVVSIPLLADLPIFSERSALEEVPPALRTPWQRYQVRLAPEPPVPGFHLRTVCSREILADRRVDPDEVAALLATERPAYVLVVVHADSGNVWDLTREVVRGNGNVLAASFAPSASASEDLLDLGFERGERALQKVLATERPGPDVEIYRMRDR